MFTHWEIADALTAPQRTERRSLGLVPQVHLTEKPFAFLRVLANRAHKIGHTSPVSVQSAASCRRVEIARLAYALQRSAGDSDMGDDE
jgi:hypothetical protein